MQLVVPTADAQAPCPPPYRAYVFIGDAAGDKAGEKGGKTLWLEAISAAEEAKSDFEDAGYEVVYRRTALIENVQAALDDPCARALWVFGHGLQDEDTGEFTTPGVTMTDGDYVSPNDLDGLSNDRTYPDILQVTFHSCGQDLQAWRDLFPNAAFNSWSGTVYGWIVRWWQFFHTYPTLDPTTGAETSANLPSPPALAESLQSKDRTRDAVSGLVLCNMAPVAKDCTLPNPLREDFGSQTFGLRPPGGIGPAETNVFDATAADGRIVAASPAGDTATNFNVEMTNAAWRSVLHDPSQFASQVGAGEITLQVVASTASPAVLLDGFRHLVFAECSGDTPGSTPGVPTRPEDAALDLGVEGDTPGSTPGVPTLSEWGLIVLVLGICLLGMGVTVTRRQ